MSSGVTPPKPKQLQLSPRSQSPTPPSSSNNGNHQQQPTNNTSVRTSFTSNNNVNPITNNHGATTAGSTSNWNANQTSTPNRGSLEAAMKNSSINNTRSPEPTSLARSSFSLANTTNNPGSNRNSLENNNEEEDFLIANEEVREYSEFVESDRQLLSWYYPDMSRQAAEQLLIKSQYVSVFLVRNSSHPGIVYYLYNVFSRRTIFCYLI